MKIPASELNARGVLLRTRSGKEYQITRNDAKDKFTLWLLRGSEAEKLSVNKDIKKLYAQVDLKK